MNAARASQSPNPIKIENDLKKPFVKMLMTKIMATCDEDKIRLPVGSGTLSPVISDSDRISVKPIVVITEPVTIGRSKRSFEKIARNENDENPGHDYAPNIAPSPWF